MINAIYSQPSQSRVEPRSKRRKVSAQSDIPPSPLPSTKPAPSLSDIRRLKEQSIKAPSPLPAPSPSPAPPPLPAPSPSPAPSLLLAPSPSPAPSTVQRTVDSLIVESSPVPATQDALLYPSSQPFVKQEQPETAAILAELYDQLQKKVKSEPIEPDISLTPPVTLPNLTTSGAYRVKHLPGPGENRVTWAQDQIRKFQELAEVEIKFSRHQLFKFL